jgi:catechol 2,3-dioxygenase-like lactoylglutathione lyase family enzyme
MTLAPNTSPGTSGTAPRTSADTAIARRVLHTCYVCRDADAATTFFVDALGMRNTMRTTDEYSPGDIFSMDQPIRSVASFVYDTRGPRVSPAIEIQAWSDPETWGSPSTDPTEVGIKAVGFTTSTFNTTVNGLTAHGCVAVRGTVGEPGARMVTLIDPCNITIDVHEDPAAPAGLVRISHLRATVTDLEPSLAFYERLGFAFMECRSLEGSALSFAPSDSADATVVTLRLPDEPFRLQLVQWHAPASHGRHYDRPFHAGLYRAALCVDDTRAAYASMSAAGAEFDRPPLEVELSGTPVPDMWITFISDPDGIPWEFVQRPRSAFKAGPHGV